MGDPPQNPHQSSRKFFWGAFVFLSLASFLTFITHFPRLTPLAIYCIATSVAVFILLGFDKSLSGSNAYRIPEHILLVGAAIGGSLGLVFGMAIFRHKIRKGQFHALLAAIIIAQVLFLHFVFGRLSFNLFIEH